MPYEMKVDGMKAISEELEKLEKQAPAVAAQALYEGAKVMRAALEEGAKGIRTAPFKFAKGGEQRLPSPEELEVILRAGVGVAKFDKNGTEVNTSVGYANTGYTKMVGKTVPIPKVVNAVNSGTSFMTRQPFVRKAVKEATAKAVEAMRAKIEEAVEAMNNK